MQNQRYVEQVVETLQILNPTLIYFYHQDVAQALRFICAERDKKFETYQVNWKVGSPYGVARSLQGFDGFIQLYQQYCALCDDIFARLTLPKLAICHENKWSQHYNDILTFLELQTIHYSDPVRETKA